MKAIFLVVAYITVCVAFLRPSADQPRLSVRTGRTLLMMSQPRHQGEERAKVMKGLTSLLAAGLVLNAPIDQISSIPAHAATIPSSQSQLKDELASMKADKPVETAVATPAVKKPAAPKNVKKVVEAPTVTSTEAQAAADAAVKAAVKAADPPKSSSSKRDIASLKNKQVEVSAPKKSVEEVALASVQEKLQVNKDRLMVVMKTELPKARDELKKLKSEGSSLESKVNKIESEKKTAKKKNADKDTFRLLDAELTDVKKRLGFVNQGISGYSKAVERSENEVARLKKEISRQGDLVKELREKYKTKSAELKAKEKKQAEDEKRKEFARNKLEAQRRVSFDKGKVDDATKEANAAASSLKKLKAKSDDLQVDLKLARKEESKRIKLVNDLRGALQKEMNTLDKQQKKIVEINDSLGETAATISGVEKEVSVKSEALSAAKAKLKSSESISKKFGD